MKIIKNACIIALLAITSIVNAQKFKQESTSLSFYSNAPLEDIYAECKKSNSVINTEDKTMALLMKPKNFIFKNPLMQEHFNEDYIESDKYPKASFQGTIVGDIDFSKDGTYNVTVKGKLKIHGVEKDREIPGTITVSGEKLKVNSKFAVKLADHGVKIPSMKIKNIAEVVEITVDITYKPLPSKK